MRMNNMNMPGPYPLFLCRSYSSDQGRSWTYPVRTGFYNAGEPGLGVLPDGGLLYAGNCVREFVLHVAADGVRKAEGIRIPDTIVMYQVSYDDGLTWSYWGDLHAVK